MARAGMAWAGLAGCAARAGSPGDWAAPLAGAPAKLAHAIAPPASSRVILTGICAKVLFGSKGSLRSGAPRCASVSVPGHLPVTRKAMTAGAADVTQGQGVGVANGDHLARGTLDLTPGAGQCAVRAELRIRLVQPARL